MSTSPTLVIMAAGMGSRYGGLKQIDPVGPSGEIVIDYSVYDAIRAGFGKVVFIIRPDIESAFRHVVEKNIAKRITVDYAFQRLDDIPDGFSVPDGRVKPWGTGHAIYACRSIINESFGVINADDFYGPDSFHVLAKRLQQTSPRSTDSCLVAYVLRNTLSDHGSVTRGVCRIEDEQLQEVVERMDIEPQNGQVRFKDHGEWQTMSGDEPVSMNMWGFSPTLFDQLGSRFPNFLNQAGGHPKAEFLIPTIVDELIREKKTVVHALHSNEKWLGVTYPEDKLFVARGIRAHVDQGTYPEVLWG